MRAFNIELHENGDVHAPYSNFFDGENYATNFMITFPQLIGLEDITDYTKRVEFELPDGTKAPYDLTTELVQEYDVPEEVLALGDLKFQFKAISPEGLIIKWETITRPVSYSINATQDTIVSRPDTIEVMQLEITALQTLVATLIELNNLITEEVV